MDDHVFFPDFDLGAFRHAAARYVKLLIRARWQCEPGFLPQEDLRRWSLGDIADDRFPAWRLVEQAAAALGVLNYDFLPRCGSGGVRLTDESTPEGRLISELAFLVYCDGGGPYHNGALLDAAQDLREGRPVDWQTLVDWDALARIRSDLDLLPQPARIGEYGGRRPAPSEPQAHSTPRNVFRRDGGEWQIRYDGDRLFLLPDSPGLTHIHQLLSNPRRTFTVIELDQVVQRRKTRPQRPGMKAEDGLHTEGTLDDGPVLDKAAMEKCREEFERINRELEQAERDQDAARIETLKEQRRELAHQVTSAVSPAGKVKKVGDKTKRFIDRVQKAISRAVEKIGQKDSHLQQHLLNCLKTGFTCAYTPERPTEWTTAT